MPGRWKSFSWSWITSRTTVGCYLNDYRRDLQGLDFISLRWMYAPCLSFMWEQSAMDANVTSFPFGSQTCIIFQPFVQVLASRAYWGYYLLPEGKSRCNIHSIHSTNHSWNISLRVPRSGQIPIAQNADAMVFFDMMAGCLSCAGLGADFLITLLDAAKTRCSGLFLFSFWSWSSQGQTWICPCFLENQCGRFPGNLMLSNYICWIGAGFIPGKAFLNAFLTVWGRKSRRTEILSAKEPRSWEVNCSSNSELTTMNSTSSSSGPLFVTLTVSHSWHRNNPPALCWWEQNRIFVGALWEAPLMKLCFRNRGIDLGMWTCRGYTVLPYCCKLSESLTHIDIKCHSAKSLPMVGGAATMIASYSGLSGQPVRS